MKNKKLLAAVILLAVVVGGFAGMKYLENRITGEIQRAFAGWEESSYGSLDFSLPGRKLVMTDVQYVLKYVEQEPEIQTIERLEAILPWDLVLSSKSEGVALVAEEYRAQGLVAVQSGARVTMEREVCRNFSTDLALFAKFFSEPSTPLEVASLVERSTMDYMLLENVEAVVPEASVRIAKIEVENLQGLKIGSARIEGTTFYAPGDTETTEVASIDVISLDDLDIPANAMRMALEMNENLVTEAAMQSLMQNLFGGQAPIVSSLSVQRIKISEELLPLSVDSFTLNWESNRPVRYSSAIAGATIPMDFIETHTGLGFPGLELLEVNTKVNVEADESGKLVERDVYQIKDVADFAFTMSILVNSESGRMLPITAWDWETMMEATLEEFELTVEDRGLVSYVLWNTEGMQATGEQTIATFSQMPGSDPENLKAMTESIAAFIRNPGTLKLTLAPEDPIPLFGLMQVMIDPSAFVRVESTPGPVSIGEAMQRLRDALDEDRIEEKEEQPEAE